MAAIMQVCDVKLSGDQMKEVAAALGPDCTPKALSHRLTYFRKLAGPSKGIKIDSATEKPTKVSKAKAPAKRAAKGKEAAAESEPTPPPTEEDDEPLTPPPSGRGKKRKSNTGDNYDGLDESVKIEVGEDIGEGLRSAAPDDDEI